MSKLKIPKKNLWGCYLVSEMNLTNLQIFLATDSLSLLQPEEKKKKTKLSNQFYDFYNFYLRFFFFVIIEEMRKLLNNSASHDVSIKIGDSYFGCHRVILCAHSQFFQIMLNTKVGIINQISNLKNQISKKI